MNILVITGFRFPYTLDNINIPQRYIVHNTSGLRYVLNRNRISQTNWLLSLFGVLWQLTNNRCIKAVLVRLIQKISKKYTNVTFLTFSDRGKLDEILLQNNWKGICVEHGNSYAMKKPIPNKHHIVKWSYHFVWSEQQKENFLQVYPERKRQVFVLGRPQKKHKIDIDFSRPLVKDKLLYIGGPGMRSDFDVFAVREDYFNQLRLWSQKNNIQIYYKPHPIEFRRKYQKSIALAKKYGLIILEKNKPEKEIAEEFDIAISVVSSYAQELRMYGMHCIQFDFERYIEGLDYDLTRTGVEYKCFTIEELDAIYRKIIKENIKRKPLDAYYLASQEELGYPINAALQKIVMQNNKLEENSAI